jgi:hypothetical protein
MQFNTVQCNQIVQYNSTPQSNSPIQQYTIVEYSTVTVQLQYSTLNTITYNAVKLQLPCHYLQATRITYY